MWWRCVMVGVVVAVVCFTATTAIRRQQARTDKTTQEPSRETFEKTEQSVTRYDGNLCHVCTATTGPCSYQSRACLYGRNTSSSRNSTRGWDRPWGRRGRECRNVTKTCTERRCVMQCCDGSPMNDDNGCSVSVTDKVDSCLNGGTPNARKTHCTCPEGFSGTTCQNRQCSVKCQNGGVCQTRTPTTSLAHTTHNDDYCVCPATTTGTFCETRVCDLQCKNNGTCKASFRYVYCSCPPGYMGTHCEKGNLKDGECPVPSNLALCSFVRYRHECTVDTDCPADNKCCSNACGQRICTPPYHDNGTCMYNNHTYLVGMIFQPDSCHVCACNMSHVGSRQAIVECARIRCPEIPQYCTRLVTPPGTCCPVCDEDPNEALCSGAYKPPYFTNCPAEQVTLEVNENSNMASVDLDLKVKDCKGDKLGVTYSERAVQAGNGEENFQLLTATSERDGKGNFAQCIFHIRIVDPYPPVIANCPSDIVMASPGPVMWEEPVATDNVGLAKPATSRRHPGIKLVAGKYVVEYVAEDLEGNQATCTFVITVENNTKPTPSVLPHRSHRHHQADQDDQDDRPSHSATVLGLVLATAIAILIIVGAAFVFWRRKNHTATAQAPTNSGRGQGTPRWHLTADSGGWNPSAECQGVPQYSLSPQETMSPPRYSQVDEMIAGLSASGGQDPGDLPTKTSLA